MYHENYKFVVEPVERIMATIQSVKGNKELDQSLIDTCGRGLQEIRDGLEYALLFTREAEAKQAIERVLHFSNGTLRDILSDTNLVPASYISSRITITIQLIHNLFTESSFMSPDAIDAVYTEKDTTSLQQEISAAASQLHCRIRDIRWDAWPICIYIDTCMPEDSIGYQGVLYEIIKICRAHGFKTNPECIYVYQEYDDDEEYEPEWWQQ